MRRLSASIALAIIICFPQSSLLAQNEKGTQNAFILSKPEPEQPEKTQGEIKEVTVVLQTIFTASGKVTNIKVVKVTPENLSKKFTKGLTSKCIKAAQKIKFTPAMKDGQPASQYIQIEYTFHWD